MISTDSRVHTSQTQTGMVNQTGEPRRELALPRRRCGHVMCRDCACQLATLTLRERDVQKIGRYRQQLERREESPRGGGTDKGGSAGHTQGGSGAVESGSVGKEVCVFVCVYVCVFVCVCIMEVDALLCLCLSDTLSLSLSLSLCVCVCVYVYIVYMQRAKATRE